MPITIIHCWSSPRSRSTALLYSFEARNDGQTIALDEPLYRRWLSGAGSCGISRPYATPFLEGLAPDGSDDSDAWRWEREKQCFNERIYHAVKSFVEKGHEDGCVFLKQMAKFSHLFDFETNWETDLDDNSRQWKDLCLQLVSDSNIDIKHRHLLLIRDPISVLSSWMGKSGDVHGNNPHPDEVGITQLFDVYSKVVGASMNRSSEEEDLIVLDSDDLADNPRKILQELCASLRVEYTDSMLKWSAGPHKCDGPWAKWWYHDVWESEGWDIVDADEISDEVNSSSGINHPRTQRYRAVPPTLLPTLRMSINAYNFLQTLTSTHRHRALSTPPSGTLYEDPRNEHLLVFVGRKGKGRIIPRDMAAISPFDSSVQGGDATWEGIRIYDGKIFHLDRHLDRLFRSARALGFENMHTRAEITEAIFRVLAANGMRDGAHLRLTLTRGEKCTSSMNPIFNVYGTTLIILPEWKPTEGATTYDNTKGIELITAGTCRRSPPSTLDNKIHHNNLIQNILPKIQANLAGVADSIMLDVEGFVAETNATNLFLVRYDGASEISHVSYEGAVLVTPSADHCLPGITRGTVLLLARELGIKIEERRVSLSEFYSADEVFTTGTMGELTPVTKIDGRSIGWRSTMKRGVVTELLQKAYKDAIATRDDWSTMIPLFS
ncbi:hypothetical protein ACHAWU_006196 [Discostella pseudostelligera]|uniref:Branched-chain-amino-acid aminotransferase n=1 Tax=Discostella pseudostelligera TaxID=259834 RepID=A0ABD3MGD5_9STRA